MKLECSLLKETVTRNHCILKEICGALRIILEEFTRPNSLVVSHKGCGLWLCVRQKLENLCSSSFFDFRMTVKCTTCSWYNSFHSTSHRYRVLYLMHMCLINDAVYEERSMHLINNMHLMHLLTRVYGMLTHNGFMHTFTPLSSLKVISAPLSTRHSTTSVWALSTAICKGVIWWREIMWI